MHPDFHQPAPGRAADTEAWFESRLKLMVKVKATAALQILATDKYNAMQLVELAVRVLRTDAERTGWRMVRTATRRLRRCR